MSYEPLGERALLRVPNEDEESTTETGLVMPAGADKGEHVQTAEVVAVGETVAAQCPVNVGDTVVVGKFAGTQINDELMLVTYDEIMARKS